VRLAQSNAMQAIKQLKDKIKTLQGRPASASEPTDVGGSLQCPSVCLHTCRQPTCLHGASLQQLYTSVVHPAPPDPGHADVSKHADMCPTPVHGSWFVRCIMRPNQPNVGTLFLTCPAPLYVHASALLCGVQHQHNNRLPAFSIISYM
jgi:hypothetical protein